MIMGRGPRSLRANALALRWNIGTVSNIARGHLASPATANCGFRSRRLPDAFRSKLPTFVPLNPSGYRPSGVFPARRLRHSISSPNLGKTSSKREQIAPWRVKKLPGAIRKVMEHRKS